MGGGGTETTTTRSGSKQVNQAVDTLGSQLNTQLRGGYKGFTGDLNPDMSSQTMAGIGALTNNPNNSIFSGGVSGALGQQAQLAQGNFGADPARARLIDDTTTAVNAAFQGSGRFGAETNKNALGDKLIGTLGAYDNARQQQAMGNMGALYTMGNMPAAANLQAGQIMDAYNSAEASEAARQFDISNNSGWQTLGQAGGILGALSGAGGQSTTTPTAPWWQTAGSYILGNAGRAASFGG